MKFLSADDYIGKWVEVIDDSNCEFVQRGEIYFVEDVRKARFNPGKSLLKLKDKIYGYDLCRFKIVNRYKNMEDWL